MSTRVLSCYLSFTSFRSLLWRRLLWALLFLAPQPHQMTSLNDFKGFFLPGLHAISFGFSLNLYILCHESMIWTTPPVVPQQVCNILEILSGAGPCLFCFRAWGRSCKKIYSIFFGTFSSCHQAPTKSYEIPSNSLKFHIYSINLCQSK